MKINDIQIRQAEEGDLFPITEIYNSVIDEGGFTADLHPFSPDERKEWYSEHLNDPYVIYVLEDKSGIRGYFYYSPWRGGREALRGIAELSFYLRSDARGKGFGDLILQRSIEIAGNSGFSYLLAILLDVNNRSRQLLEKWGFEICGRLPDIADLVDRHSGQLIMLKKLY